MAETTTTGRRSSLPRTISMTRSIASASWSEAPPNFMTIIAFSVEIPARLHQFRVKNRRARGASYGVVREDYESDVEYGAGSNTAYDRAHRGARIPVEARLRPLTLIAHDERPSGRGWQLEFLRQRREVRADLRDRLRRRLLRKLY